MPKRKNTVPVRDVQQLVFVEYPTFVHVEIIPRRMLLWGITLCFGNILAPNGSDGQAPLLVFFRSYGVINTIIFVVINH